MSVSYEWKPVVTLLRERGRLTTPSQIALASKLDFELDERLPALVSASYLRGWIASEIGQPPVRNASYGQLTYLRDLSDLLGTEPPDVEFDSALASAWIEWMDVTRTANDLETLEPARGDVVLVEGVHDELAIVSSISSNGHVNLLGRGGSGKRPHRLSRVGNANDESDAVKQMRNSAEQLIALRMRPASMSGAKARTLSRHRVESPATSEEIALLRETIDDATDERPIQKLIEKCPALLATLDMQGHATYVRSQVSLAGKLIPDFMLATVDSAGIHWTYVELESPTEDMGLADGTLAKNARKGVEQIKSWRRLVMANLNVARNPESDFGTGLVDIRPNSPGVVIIGRRGSTRLANSDVRNELEEDLKIKIKTYDWLLQAIERPTQIAPFRDQGVYDALEG
ncbi:MAG: Shedu anti-phage system protein SduA domain-containing protein, partial [Solirubrobacterales bacterium]